MTDPLYHLEGITHSYRGRAEPALMLTEPLMIERGEIFALVGPSGAGKSTLLRLLALIEPPTTGTVSFMGEMLNGHAPAPIALRRRASMVFQRPILLSDSVYANVAYPLKLRGAPVTHGKVEQALAQVGLTALQHAPSRTLSGGEAQRVALARALVIEPAALLLDEPTANLDPYNTSLIEQRIHALRRERQTTCIIVTHNLFQAKRLADRIGLLLQGKLIEVAPRDTFFTHPRDPRTRAFVNGEMVY
jgi:tungstate transport system ATP-binding protein